MINEEQPNGPQPPPAAGDDPSSPTCKKDEPFGRGWDGDDVEEKLGSGPGPFGPFVFVQQRHKKAQQHSTKNETVRWKVDGQRNDRRSTGDGGDDDEDHIVVDLREDDGNFDDGHEKMAGIWNWAGGAMTEMNGHPLKRGGGRDSPFCGIVSKIFHEKLRNQLPFKKKRLQRLMAFGFMPNVWPKCGVSQSISHMDVVRTFIRPFCNSLDKNGHSSRSWME
ncbi:hypothetical protein niasHT_001491 [Heterodera trifolii]|uniref:Uncharacterized protein n=1 Tax=Heterodera trifolii TaxID=157864 RepID=A0ABD2M4G4_9BILA